MTGNHAAKIKYIHSDFSIADLHHQIWSLAEAVKIEKYWSGEIAPQERHADVAMLWSRKAFYIRFIANQAEPLNLNSDPNLSSKTHRLWEKDVCEVFISPDTKDHNRYFEFEISPAGEWIDLEIQQHRDRRETNWNYTSGMKTAAIVDTDNATMGIKIEWDAFGKFPVENDIWFGNLFRIVGIGKTRGYLTLNPTETKEPNFHVSEKFGEFVFVK